MLSVYNNYIQKKLTQPYHRNINQANLQLEVLTDISNKTCSVYGVEIEGRKKGIFFKNVVRECSSISWTWAYWSKLKCHRFEMVLLTVMTEEIKPCAEI